MTNLQGDKIVQLSEGHNDCTVSDRRSLSDIELRTIFDCGTDTALLPELVRIFSTLLPSAGEDFIVKLHNDIEAIFDGKMQGFRKSTVKYHDLRHTRSVVLATLRLFHGLKCDGHRLSDDVIKIGTLCAYFHDTGMLLRNDDSESCGSAYLKCHEERSIKFAREYIHNQGLPHAYWDHCAPVISCTNLKLKPDAVAFESEEIELTGHVLGTADILAQMGDRYYLECLPLLYMEQRDAGIKDFNSAMELIQETATFYHETIEKRLLVHFKSRCSAMRTHFRERWGIDRNLYLEFIEKNILYLKKIVASSEGNPAMLEHYLRRRQPQTDR